MIDVSATFKHDHLTVQHPQYQRTPPHNRTSHNKLVDMQRYDFFFQTWYFSLKKRHFLQHVAILEAPIGFRTMSTNQSLGRLSYPVHFYQVCL